MHEQVYVSSEAMCDELERLIGNVGARRRAACALVQLTDCCGRLHQPWCTLGLSQVVSGIRWKGDTLRIWACYHGAMH